MNEKIIKQKRIFDLLFLALFIPLILPIFFIIYFCLFLCYGRHIIFKQGRTGYKGRPFFIYKFRTMRGDKDRFGNLLPDKYRITTFGKYLRSSSLDELPEIWNVIKGDMSIVGPRALPLIYTEYLTKEEMKRFFVRPGMTGLAQIKGRNCLTWEERFRYDLEYINNLSLINDIKIILLTIWIVISSKGFILDPESVMLNLDKERKAKII